MCICFILNDKYSSTKLQTNIFLFKQYQFNHHKASSMYTKKENPQTK